MPKTKRFAEYEFSIKLFQVSVSNDSPKAALIPDTPASQAAVPNPASWLPQCRHGEYPVTPLHHWQKKMITKCVCLRNGSQYQPSELALYIRPLVVCRRKCGVKAPARLTSTGNARRVCGIIGKQDNGVTKADFQKYGCHESKL